MFCSFCDDDYVGCCKFDEECDIVCLGVLVAGCEEPPTPTSTPSVPPTDSPSVSLAPTTSASPTEPPSESMEPTGSKAPTVMPFPDPSAFPTVSMAPTEKVCLIDVNRELCDDLMANQTRIPGCDCYNFCNGEFNGECKREKRIVTLKDYRAPVADMLFSATRLLWPL